ncbi:MAG: hypothetical protein GY943_27960 [Chloroflexi bacterium]|nr:hypothetical protein [Chloroflexota bacterium]
MNKKENAPPPSTLAALLKEKPKRGRPPHAVSRQNVYVSLSSDEKKKLRQLVKHLPEGIVRADIPDLVITILSARFDALRNAVSGRSREIPEGITDLLSLYLLWDLPLPENNPERKWTSIRLSPQTAIELGRVQGTLNIVFGSNRSDIFCLGIVLLEHFVQQTLSELKLEQTSLDELRQLIISNYL